MKSWKQDLAPYVEPDRRRSLAQIASVVVPYLAILGLAVVLHLGPVLAVVFGLIATVFLVRMYSLFHDLTHNSMFSSRAANRTWGYLLGFLLFTPYRWWQRQHSLHHAHTGNLDKRGPGEIYTMTLAEYEGSSVLRRLGYRAYRNPLLMMFVGPALVFMFERRFPQRGMSRRILASVVVTNLALAAWAIGWSTLLGWETFAIVQGTTLIAGGALAAWMLYIQHQYEHTYYETSGEWQFERAALQGSSYLELPRALAWVVGNANYHHVHHLSARIPNYRLRAAHEQHPIFARTPVVTLRSSIAALQLKLWDEQRGRLVRFPKMSFSGARMRAPADRRMRRSGSGPPALARSASSLADRAALESSGCGPTT
ncbi:MAG: fatty acid desaturase [Solirubrobacterales bacterium]|nr:fatty acid desaturase [Solirubrobacterales bacterium]